MTHNNMTLFGWLAIAFAAAHIAAIIYAIKKWG